MMTANLERENAFQIKAQVLQDMGVAGSSGPAFGLSAVREQTADILRKHGRRLGCWKERDLNRAIAVARRAGLTAYRIELAPDGTISIVVGQPKPIAARRQRRGI